jgi:hypothetical protein
MAEENMYFNKMLFFSIWEEGSGRMRVNQAQTVISQRSEKVKQLKLFLL